MNNGGILSGPPSSAVPIQGRCRQDRRSGHDAWPQLLNIALQISTIFPVTSFEDMYTDMYIPYVCTHVYSVHGMPDNLACVHVCMHAGLHVVWMHGLHSGVHRCVRMYLFTCLAWVHSHMQTHALASYHIKTGCRHTCVHTYLHTHKHPCRLTGWQTDRHMHANRRTYTRMCMYTYIHTYIHTYIRRIHASMCTCIYIYIIYLSTVPFIFGCPSIRLFVCTATLKYVRIKSK